MSDRLVTDREIEGILRRLGRLEGRVERTATNNEIPYGFSIGTSFPTSPATNDVFFRTDLGFLCFYDGTRWLTLHEYVQPIIIQTDLTVNTDSPLTTVALSAAFGIYVDRVSVITRVSTTNSGANYWTITVQGINTAVTASSTIYSFATSGDAVNVYVAREGVDGGANVPANDSWLRINATKTGAPGTLRVAATAYYRIIVL